MNDYLVFFGWLEEELDRLIERYADEPIAIEALEAVKYWAIEGGVEES